MPKAKKRQKPKPPPPRPVAAPRPPSPSLWRHPLLLPAAALIALIAAAHGQTLAADFVWDDKIFILQSAQIREWSGLAAIWFNPAYSNELHYWPVLNSSFWLDHKLWGFNPAGFHATNLALHTACSLLLWRLLARMEPPAPAATAWVIAALFALHPTHAEPVAWITARKDLLSALFYLLGLKCYLRFAETRRRAPYAALLLCYLAACLSKTVAITLPAALAIYLWWRGGRVTGRDLKHLAPLFAIGVAVGVYGIAYYSGRAHIAFEYSLAERVVIAAKALWFYAAKLLFPHPLNVIYPHWDANPARAGDWLPFIAALALAAALYTARRRIGRGPLAGALFFAVTLSPMLGFADNSYMKFSFVADRYQYLAAVGPLMVFVAAAARLWRRLPGGARPLRAAVALLLLACGFATARHGRVFHDDAALFAHITATNPAAPRAWSSYGAALIKNDPAAAVRAFETALKYEPADTYTYVRLGEALIDLRQYNTAAEVLRRAMGLGLDKDAGVNSPLRKDHLGAKIPHNLGVAYLRQQRPQAAAAAFRRVLELEPGNAQSRQSLATALREQGRFEEALSLLRDIAESAPTARLYLRLAEVAAAQGDAALAETYNRRALDLDPDYLPALRPLAATHFNAGRYEQAARLYQRITALAPADAESHMNHGATLARLGRRSEAIRGFEQALAIDPDLAPARAYLEAARRQMNESR